MKRLLLVLSVCLLAAAPAFADITVTMSVSMNMGPIVSSGQATGTAWVVGSTPLVSRAASFAT